MAFRETVSDCPDTDIYLLGGCEAGMLGAGQSVLREGIYGFCFLLIVFGVGLNPKQRQIFGPVLAPFLIGITTTLIRWASTNIDGTNFSYETNGTASFYSGAAVNPACCQGLKWAAMSHPKLPGASSLSSTWCYWLGAVLAVFLHTCVFVLAPPVKLGQDDAEGVGDGGYDDDIFRQDSAYLIMDPESIRRMSTLRRQSQQSSKST